MLEVYAQKYSNNKWALRDPFSFANNLGAIAFVLRQPLLYFAENKVFHILLHENREISD